MTQADPWLLALLAGMFTYAMTAAGAALVFLGRAPSRRVQDVLLGFSAGVMLSASYFSLLGPALRIAEESDGPTWVAPTIGFLAGALVLAGLDNLLPHMHRAGRRPVVDGVAVSRRTRGAHRRHDGDGTPESMQRVTLLVTAVTLHNIPEGLAVGVAVGAAASAGTAAAAGTAVALALGLGIQNLPEGLAISAPLAREGLSRSRSFFFGQLSGTVEPIAAVIGAALVGFSSVFLPYGLAFAAGAMIFVVIEELVPECQRQGHADAAVLGAMVGFALMMVLDVALGA